MSMSKVKIAVWFSVWLLMIAATPMAAEEENRTIKEALESDEEAVEEADVADSERAVVDGETDGGTELQLTEEKSVFFILLQLIAALAVVIFIMYALLKFINKRTMQYQSNRVVQNIGGVPLGQQKSVQLIRTGNRLFVIGVGDTVTLIKEIDQQEEIDELLSAANIHVNTKAPQSAVTKLFKRFLTKDQTPQVDASFHRVLEQQLRELTKTQKQARQHIKGSRK
ncbi:flagellar protein FliO/FliZ [Alteribacillus persepolensis]|uniref:Flagellar protein FliO/FliZ n=1 Tax=Alteribacillus persepolensis TaxID=568899 RepID=A0A1G7YPL7_9BACI|nr:flagellar biosynthetic protein FliO [Alteribacillus persepolensis]SDG98235.1 flagellar protein FliO/FliZ [Alteribacillus persepolensis]